MPGRFLRACGVFVCSSQLALAVAQDRAAGPPLHISQRSLAQLQTEPGLAREIAAGAIPRASLHAELARGVAQFLQQVRTEPAFERGRFVGWRVLSLFAKRTDVRVRVLKPGDTVVRVNGRSLEHPEDLQALWSSLRDAHELTLEIRRDAQPSKLRYAIVD